MKHTDLKHCIILNLKFEISDLNFHMIEKKNPKQNKKTNTVLSFYNYSYVLAIFVTVFVLTIQSRKSFKLFSCLYIYMYFFFLCVDEK